jgi:hypothetical protein
MSARSLLCAHLKPEGKRCAARPLKDSNLCFFHDPRKQEERDEARSAGGRKNRPVALPPTTPSVDLRTVEGLVALIEASINEVHRGDIDPKVGNAIGCLASLQFRLLEHRLEERVANLERIISNRSEGSSHPDDNVGAPLLESQQGERR